MAKKKKLNLKRDILATLSVVLGITFIIPLVIYFISKDKHVRLNSIQSILFFMLFVAVQWVTQLVTHSIYESLNFTLPFVPLITVAAFLIWILMAYRAWMGNTWEIPIISVYSKNIMKKIKT